MELLYENFNYPSAKRFYDILKEKGLVYTLKQVKEFIEKQNVAQIHKVVRKSKIGNSSITANEPNELFQIDLLDYQKYGTKNNGYKWILICVDVFTRTAYAVAIKTKGTEHTKSAFQQIVLNNKPKVVFMDDGNEWKNEFSTFVDKENIISIQNTYGNHNALGIIDRFSRTLKEMIERHFSATNTLKWIDILPKLIKIYNNTPHVGIKGIKPNDATNEDNLIKISTLNFNKNVENNTLLKSKVDKLKVGDKVRVKIQKGTFAKGYEITYTKTVYVIKVINGVSITLTNDKDYHIDTIQKVYDGSTDIVSKVKEKVEKVEKIKRKINKENIKDFNNAGKYYK